MPVKIKETGAWANIKAGGVFVKEGGAWVSIQKGFAKEAGTWNQVYQDEEQYTLGNSTNVNLATYLSGQGASTSAPIRINIPSGVTIGATSTSTAAITSGNLSSYEKVILEIEGNVLGAGGAAASSGGAAISLTSAISLRIFSTGAVRGGGGGGGRGGNGGAGNDIGSYSGWVYSNTPPYYYYEYNGIIYWNGTHSGYAQASSTAVYGAYVYGRDGVNVDGLKQSIRRAFIYVGTPGTGGAGAVGRGYGQSAGFGASGTNGTSRAGNGGRGGNGGEWGSGGYTGQTGATGYSWVGYSSAIPSGGSGGTLGGGGGYAISAAGLSIPYWRQGAISGSTNFTAIPYDG